MKHPPLQGLIAAVHTPFDAAGDLALAAVARQAEHLQAQGLAAVFVAGTTGEGQSLTTDERQQLAQRWVEVTAGSGLEVIVHAGHNCLRDAAALAAHAQRIGARAVAAAAPSYFKPATTDALLGCCAAVAGAAPALPFYYYDIPSWTGVQVPTAALLQRALDAIANFAGVKFTSQDLAVCQALRRAHGGAFEVLWGCDEALLAGLALGCEAAVGSTYNFAAPLAHAVWTAFAQGDLDAARRSQDRIARLVEVMAADNYLGAARRVLAMLGVALGPPRLPCEPLDDDAAAALRARLDGLGFFDWIR